MPENPLATVYDHIVHCLGSLRQLDDGCDALEHVTDTEPLRGVTYTARVTLEDALRIIEPFARSEYGGIIEFPAAKEDECD